MTRTAVVAAATAALVVPAGSLASAQHSEETSAKAGREPIVFTIDVAEDLAGKFVPTLVKPEHTQPERGSFFITEGRIFPGGTIEGDGASFNPNRSGHIGVWFCRGTHLVAASEIPGAPLWFDSAQLFISGVRAGTAGHRRGEGRRHRHAYRDRRRGNSAGFIRRTAPDVPRVQSHRRRQPAG